MKYALVTGAHDSKQVAAYLPDNYSVLREVEVEVAGRTAVLIGGQDTLGWTFADYVQPRLASGLIWAEEIPVNEMLDLVGHAERCPDCGQPDNCGDCDHTPC